MNHAIVTFVQEQSQAANASRGTFAGIIAQTPYGPLEAVHSNGRSAQNN